ncbi:MAG: DUF262 domain-containing protein [Chloroflexi bacterium]|nr:DUF262 domain-containing protein [Chloroflexota bacterium]
MLDQFTIADVLTWIDEGTLVLNADFQRRSVWPPAARAYLIDTVLRGRSMPKIYMRTMTDPKTRRSYREVVDGQQRLLAIRAFANDSFSLGPSKETYGEFASKSYSDLDETTQRSFLSYQLSVEQLFNASDEEVFDTFHRLNAYGLDVNRQELRHGKWQGAFRTAVIEASRRWSILWDQYKVVGLRARVRMGDDELMAQMLGVVLEGVVDGGQPITDRLYRRYDESIPTGAVKKLDRAVKFAVSNLQDILETGLAGAPHFLMLFAAIVHALNGIPKGDMKDAMPKRKKTALTDLAAARANLGLLADFLVMDADDVPERFRAFKFASAGTTQRIKSRSVRFAALYRALSPRPL